MKIHPNALERVKIATINGTKLAQMFEQLAAEAEVAGGVSNSFTVDYQHTSDEVDTDTWIPQIILVLRSAK
jgi:hypothetical protein